MRMRRLSLDRMVLLASCLMSLVSLAVPALAEAPDDCRQSATQVPESARPLSESGLRNVIAFARLLGYVRHFHPSDQAAAANWDQLAIEGMRRIEACEGPERVAATLEAYFHPVAPTVQVFPTGREPAAPAGLTPPAGATDLKLLSWRHVGAGQVAQPRSDGQVVYHSERVSTSAGSRAPIGSQPDQVFTADLGAGLTARVPLKLYADASGTLPHRAPPVPMLASLLRPAGQEDQASGDDRATRLAAVALAWNVFQNFYPYFDVVDTDWPRELERALTTAATDADARAFRDTLLRMVAALHDGHGRVFNSKVYAPTHALPLAWVIVDDKLVITRVTGEAADGGLKPGDVVLAMNSEPTEQVLSREGALISSATPQWTRYLLPLYIRVGSAGSEVRLKVQSQGAAPREVVLSRSVKATDAPAEPRPPTVAELEPGIMYFDIGRATEDDVEPALPKLAEAKAVIFDLRGYPSTNDYLLYLSDQRLQGPIFQIPIVTRPDRLGPAEHDDPGRWDLPPQEPRFKGRIIFMTDGRAVSWAESVMITVEAYRLADIVGATTAGTNGDINPFVVPGGYTLWWTGLRVLKHDGSRHHGVGVRPTHPVNRTIKGIAEGRDEILDKALELARTPRQ